MQLRTIDEMKSAFLAPFAALSFLRKNLLLLALGLAPFVIGAFVYFWALEKYVMTFLTQSLVKYGILSLEQLEGVGGFIVDFSTYLAAFILFVFIGLPIINALASPLYDTIAAAAFEKASGRRLPNSSFAQTVRGIFSEFVKACALLSFMFLAFVFPFWGPLLFVFGVWLFGWEIIDRTLALQQLPLKERVRFGIRHFPACASLGIWLYVPLVGSLFAFTMAAAGAIAVAKIAPKNKSDVT